MGNFLLMCLTIASIWMVQDPNSRTARYACLVGLASQPFWLYYTFDVNTWGAFISSLFMTFVWFRGIVNHWLPIPLAEKIRAFFLQFKIKI